MRYTFYSNGKLLLTGEYVVLDGALALALPSRFGQSLTVETLNTPILHWKSLDAEDNPWFEAEFTLQNGDLRLKINHELGSKEISGQLFKILKSAQRLNPNFLGDVAGVYVESKLTFPRHWGLGSSSTLINNLADWANCNAYDLLELTFGGSGYDIACAQHQSAITYQLPGQTISKLKKKSLPYKDKRRVTPVQFRPNYRDCLYFVYLNRKQDSRSAIERYRKNPSNVTHAITEVTQLTLQFLDCTSLVDFENLIEQHEAIISNIIEQPSVKTRLFHDFEGSIKSLGAWGGDFVLATSQSNPSGYFKSKGFETVVPFEKMILS